MHRPEFTQNSILELEKNKIDCYKKKRDCRREEEEEE